MRLTLSRFKSLCQEVTAKAKSINKRDLSLKELCQEQGIQLETMPQTALFSAAASLKAKKIFLSDKGRADRSFRLAHEAFHLLFPEFHALPSVWQELLADQFAYEISQKL